MQHEMNIRVYYEDTDAGGIVYHASYIRFAERGRTELLRAAGFEHAKRLRETKTGFAVVHLDVAYKAPAKLDDLLTLKTRITRVGGASMEMGQDIYRGDQLLAAMKVTVVCIDSNLKAVRLPPEIRQMYEQGSA